MKTLPSFSLPYKTIITSAGRTGTKFFGDTLQSLIPEAVSVHEPDVWNGLGYHPWRSLRDFGVYHMIIGKILKTHGLRNLSEKFLSGKMSQEDLISALYQHRYRYYKHLKSKFVIEAYSGWFGVIPGVQKLYEHYKVAVIIRDPRTWVVSNLNWGTLYGRRDWVGKFGLGRLTPKTISDSIYINRWPQMTPLQKLCWAWKTIYGILFSLAEEDENIQFFRFEDLFLGESREQALEQFLTFITQFKDQSFPFQLKDNYLNQKIHKSEQKKFPEWNQWASQDREALIENCKPLMDKFFYEI